MKGRRGLLIDAVMIGLVILGIGIPTGLIDVGPISGRFESDLVFRATVVVAFDLAILVLILALGLLKLNRAAQLLASLILIESVVLGSTALDLGWTMSGIMLISACVLSLVMVYVVDRFFRQRARGQR